MCFAADQVTVSPEGTDEGRNGLWHDERGLADIAKEMYGWGVDNRTEAGTELIRRAASRFFGTFDEHASEGKELELTDVRAAVGLINIAFAMSLRK